MTKFSVNSKLFFIIKIFIIYFIICLKGYSDNTDQLKNMVTVGSNNADIKIKIFSSLTCPHCAYFHTNVVSQIKKEYIESGKVQLIFIDFPLDQAAFNASKLLNCLDKNLQMKFLDLIYEKQSKWTAGSNINEINENLKKIVETLGISQDSFDKCLVDEDISDKILNGRIEANRKYSINSTPTIIINEKKFEGSVSFEDIKKKIEKLI